MVFVFILYMPKNIKYSTLCSTCKNVKNCTTLKYSDRPILFCEDFCIDIFLNTDYSNNEKQHIKKSNNKNNTDSKTYFGLCINCDNRHNCNLSNSEGGVWHCEEYQ